MFDIAQLESSIGIETMGAPAAGALAYRSIEPRLIEPSSYASDWLEGRCRGVRSRARQLR